MTVAVADNDVLDRSDVTEGTLVEPLASVVELDSSGCIEVDETREAL